MSSVPVTLVGMRETPSDNVVDPTDAPWADRLAVFDLETTGVNPRQDRIVTAFVGELDRTGNLTHSREWLVNPGIEIPERATEVHGVSTERAQAEGRDAREAVGEIAGLLGRLFAAGIPVAAFNGAYDFTLLDAELSRHGYPALTPSLVIDPLIIDKQVDRFRRGKRTLGAVATHYGVQLDDWHAASADAIAAGHIAQAIGRREESIRIPAHQLHAAQEQWAREQAESFAEYMRANRDPDFKTESGWPVRTG